MNYTLTKFLLVNMEFFVKIQATAAPLVEEIGTKYLLRFRLTSLLSDYTLKRKNSSQHAIFCHMYKFTGYCTVNDYHHT